MMRHVITLVAANPSLTAVEAFVTHHPDIMHWEWLEAGAALDMFTATPPQAPLLAALREMADRHQADMIVQPAENREKRLLISDMDSTMIAQECIDELADCLGIKTQVAAITERAMQGELDFAQALTERVALLKGLPEAMLQEVFTTRISFTPGARTLVQTMRARGAYCLLVSGGFTFFTTRVAAALGFHAAEANQLEIAGAALTGRVIPPILDKHSKQASLRRTLAERQLPLSAALAVGDGANDLPMLQTAESGAGLGVAYRAKPAVQRAVAAQLNHTDLTSLLYAQGIARRMWA